MSFGSGNGYYIITLYNNGKAKKYYVHQIVAMSFLNHIPNGYDLVVDHINNNKLDNIINLSDTSIAVYIDKNSKYNIGIAAVTEVSETEIFRNAVTSK
jgi:hypothetical protein